MVVFVTGEKLELVNAVIKIKKGLSNILLNNEVMLNKSKSRNFSFPTNFCNQRRKEPLRLIEKRA